MKTKCVARTEIQTKERDEQILLSFLPQLVLGTVQLHFTGSLLLTYNNFFIANYSFYWTLHSKRATALFVCL